MNGERRQDSAFQRFAAPIVPLVNVSAAGSGTANISFHVPVPDARLRTKVSLLFVPEAGSALTVDLTVGLGTLWLYEVERDRSGISGIFLPAANIFGDAATPASIPSAGGGASGAGLYGYSREFQTLADGVQGAFSTKTFNQIGTYYLQVTYAPYAVRFTPEEWDQITQQCNPSRIGPVQTI